MALKIPRGPSFYNGRHKLPRSQIGEPVVQGSYGIEGRRMVSENRSSTTDHGHEKVSGWESSPRAERSDGWRCPPRDAPAGLRNSSISSVPLGDTVVLSPLGSY